VLSLTVACGSRQGLDPKLTEIHRTRSGNLNVVVLAPTDGLKQTRNYCTVEFRSAADQRLVDVGTVTARTSMTMEGAPMGGFVTDPKPVAPGRYTVEMVLAMAGDWTIAIDWMGPAGAGAINFPAVVK
jgi:hypothetical protein